MIAQASAFRIPLPSESVHTICTSPPYWGLRKYSGNQGEEPLGLESTPEKHVARMVEICRELWRILRPDGVLWWNYGDCYGTGTTAARQPGNRGIGQNTQDAQDIDRHGGQAGQLMMMPHRVALALQADGWIVRQDLVWYKRNPMPESIAGTRWVKHQIKEGRNKHAADHNIKGGTQKMLEDASVHQGIDEDWVPKYVDCPGCEKCIPNDGLVVKRGSWRHTRAHEYVFMLTKKMKYWSNQEAVREGHSDPKWIEGALSGRWSRNADDKTDASRNDGKSLHGEGISYGQGINPGGRNPRSVLDIPTAPYKGAHYATFPPNLIAPLIRATCPRRCCPVCGQGWAAVVEKASSGTWHDHSENLTQGARQNSGGPQADFERGQVLGYRPTCEHTHTQEEAVPGIVFDPFVGSGTTIAVAKDLLRRGIGIDISMEYLDQQAKVRAGLGSPSNQFENLPLFGGEMVDEPKIPKQDQVGKRTYTGFNERWGK